MSASHYVLDCKRTKRKGRKGSISILWIIALVAALIVVAIPFGIIGRMHEMDFQRALADFESKFPENSTIVYGILENYSFYASLTARIRALAGGTLNVGKDDFLNIMNDNNISTVWKMEFKSALSPHFKYWFSNGTIGYSLYVDSRTFH